MLPVARFYAHKASLDTSTIYNLYLGERTIVVSRDCRAQVGIFQNSQLELPGQSTERKGLGVHRHNRFISGQLDCSFTSDARQSLLSLTAAKPKRARLEWRQIRLDRVQHSVDNNGTIVIFRIQVAQKRQAQAIPSFTPTAETPAYISPRLQHAQAG